MQRLQGGHSRWLNARHRCKGQVFRHRFWSRRIEDDGWLLRACIYVAVNPVAAGVCSHPRDFRWCTYDATAHGDPDRYTAGEERLLGLFGDSPREARARYAEVVDEAVELIRDRRLADRRSVWEALHRFEQLRVRHVSG